MNEIIKKYEAKLDYLNKAVEQTKNLMDEDTLDMMNDIKILLTEVVTDFKDVRALAGISDVIQTLNDFHEWSLTQDAMFDHRLIPNYIEYLKSFNVV